MRLRHTRTRIHASTYTGAAQLSHSSVSIAGAQEMTFLEHYGLWCNVVTLTCTISLQREPKCFDTKPELSFCHWDAQIGLLQAAFLRRRFSNGIIRILYIGFFFLFHLSLASSYPQNPSEMQNKHMSCMCRLSSGSIWVHNGCYSALLSGKSTLNSSPIEQTIPRQVGH